MMSGRLPLDFFFFGFLAMISGQVRSLRCPSWDFLEAGLTIGFGSDVGRTTGAGLGGDAIGLHALAGGRMSWLGH